MVTVVKQETSIVKAKPTSPGRRHQVNLKHKHLAKTRKIKKLAVSRSTFKKRYAAGRGKQGITVRHKSTRNRLYYLVDFKRRETVPGKVVAFEYDPNRTAHIALISYYNGSWGYIVAPGALKIGDEVQSGPEAPIKPGNCLPLRNIPIGTTIYGIELKPGKGAQMVLSAGVEAMLLALDGGYATIRLPSGEMRKVRWECSASIGTVSNSSHKLRQLGKAGRSRHLGRRPTVRGVVMNPVDHPHGGGEGRTSGGRHPVTPWGVPTKGKRTRHNKRTDQLILRRRKK